MKKLLSGITGLRGLAALAVVFYHLNQSRSTVGLSELSWDIYQFTEHLVFVVSFFFMTSWLFRSLPYWRAIFQGKPIPDFFSSLRERFFRIAPAYYLALFVTFIFVIAWQWVGLPDFVRLFAGMSFVSWISPQTFFPVEINWPLWFISYDMMGWIIVSGFMGTLAKMRWKNNKAWIAIFFAIMAIVLLWIHYIWMSLPWTRWVGIVGEWFPTYNPFLFGLHFLLGATAGGMIVYFEEKKSHILADVMTLLSFGVLFGFLWNIRGSEDWTYSWPHGPYHFPVVSLLLVIILVLLPFTQYIGQILDNHILTWIATLSYSLYLFHMLVIVSLRRYFFTDIQLWFYNWSIFSILTLILSLGISWVVWKYVETREWRKKNL